MPGPYCTAADVKAFATEFASLADAAFDPYIARASRELNPTVWGQRVVDAAVLLVAHYMTLFPPAGFVGGGAATVGPIVSKTVGSVSVTYAAPSVSIRPTAGALASTKYGAEYSRMVQQVCAGPWMLG